MKNQKSILDQKRRRLVKLLIGGAGTISVLHLLPDKWSSPLIEMVVLPAHAETSGMENSENGNSAGSSAEITLPPGVNFDSGTHSWTVPAGVSRVLISLASGSGGGGGGAYDGGAIGAGNGGDGVPGELVSVEQGVASGQVISLTIGSGGGGGGRGLVGTASSAGSDGGTGADTPAQQGGDQAGGGGGFGGDSFVLIDGTEILRAVGGNGGGGGGSGGDNDGSNGDDPVTPSLGGVAGVGGSAGGNGGFTARTQSGTAEGIPGLGGNGSLSPNYGGSGEGGWAEITPIS